MRSGNEVFNRMQVSTGGSVGFASEIIGTIVLHSRRRRVKLRKAKDTESSIMPSQPDNILTINGGSSSIKFAVFATTDPLQRGLVGKLDRIGQLGAQLSFSDPLSGEQDVVEVGKTDYASAVEFLVSWLESQDVLASVAAIGHRVVHGMQRTHAELVTLELMDELHRISPYAPEHLPGEFMLIEAFNKRHPMLPQVCCFDTAFHRTMPRVAKLLPIPRRYQQLGVERYGFHGLSYEYLIQELERLGDPAATRGRVILAHLGNGASMAAVRDGECIDTSMSFTPASGLPMGTRSGDLDPGLINFLSQTENMTPVKFDRMVNHESGLLGVSETSSDVRDLLAIEASDVRAEEALAMFCYQAKKKIGSYAAALGGLDTLVFSGGIGENSSVIRSRICEGLQFLGIELATECNAENQSLISADAGRVAVRVIRANEEQVIGDSVCRVLGLKTLESRRREWAKK